MKRAGAGKATARAGRGPEWRHLMGVVPRLLVNDPDGVATNLADVFARPDVRFNGAAFQQASRRRSDFRRAKCANWPPPQA